MTVNDEFWPSWNITKLEAARRQLDTAIRLLFTQDDAVSVHTLAHAAFGILKGLADYHDENRVLNAAKSIAQRTNEKEFWKSFNRTGNYFKHADKDATEVLSEVPEEENEALIHLAIEIYKDLNAPISTGIQVFDIWWRCINFENINDAEEHFILWLDANSHRLHDEARSDLLALGNELLLLFVSNTNK